MSVEKENDGRIYSKVILKLLQEEVLKVDDEIFVLCAGTYDKIILEKFNFKNVTISNLDEKYKGAVEPFTWKKEDAENLSIENNSYDWAIVHAGLHHCYSPHKAMVEMLRVSKKGILVFEGKDNLINRIAQNMGFVSTYEIEAVIGNDLKRGGVQNSVIPNYVYRWSEREVFKVVNCFLPQFNNNEIRFFYNLRFPQARLQMHKSTVKYLFYNLSKRFIQLFTLLFPKQKNEFGFLVKKGDRLHKWLIEKDTGLQISKEYVSKHFNTERSDKF